MKKTTLLFTLLLSTLSFSQQGFIEVEVRDSIKLKVSKFEYLIEIVQNSEDLYANDNINVVDTRNKIKEKTRLQKIELEKFLNKNNYTYRLPENGYLINNNSLFNDKSFIITLKSKAEINKVRKDFKKFNYINISLKETLFENKLETQLEAEKRLFKKLIEKATKKASMIAELSRLKLGKIIEFKEVKEIDNLSFNIMDLYITSQSNLNTKGVNYINNYKAIVIKFIAK